MSSANAVPGPEPTDQAKWGVLVMAYGSPSSLDNIREYYTHIRRGRPPTEDQVAELRDRYDQIGGVDRLPRMTEDQRTAIQSAITELTGVDVPVAIGQKHAAPFVADGIASLTELGVSRIVGVVMAPHFSNGSVAGYHREAAAAAAQFGVAYAGIERWWDLPPFSEFYATAIRELAAEHSDRYHVLFTAHSLPERILVDDPYADELFSSADLISRIAGLREWTGWSTCWQSAGQTAEPWRGPDIAAVLGMLAETGRATGVIVCPQGFTADHLEVAYDLDTLAADIAAELGLGFVRTPTIGADPATMTAIAQRIVASAQELQAT